MCIRDREDIWVPGKEPQKPKTPEDEEKKKNERLQKIFNKLVEQSEIEISQLILDCLLYTSDAADERSSVDLGGRRIIKKKKNKHTNRMRIMKEPDQHYTDTPTLTERLHKHYKN